MFTKKCSWTSQSIFLSWLRIRRLNSSVYIDDKTLDYLSVNSNPRAGRFYLLPKIHKRGCPGSPVISGCGTCTEQVSEFVDHHITREYLVTLRIANIF